MYGLVVEHGVMSDMPESLGETWAERECRICVCDCVLSMKSGGMAVDMHEVEWIVRIADIVEYAMAEVYVVVECL